MVVHDFEINEAAQRDASVANPVRDVRWGTISIYEIKFLEAVTPIVASNANENILADATAMLEGELDSEHPSTPTNMCNGRLNTRWTTNRNRITCKI